MHVLIVLIAITHTMSFIGFITIASIDYTIIIAIINIDIMINILSTIIIFISKNHRHCCYIFSPGKTFFFPILLISINPFARHAWAKNSAHPIPLGCRLYERDPEHVE